MRFVPLCLVHSIAFSLTYTRFTAAVILSNSSASSIDTVPSPANQTGPQAALACWQQWDDYSSSSTNCPKTTITGSTTTWTSKVTSTIRETFKLCDGHPRAVATGGERTSTSLGSMSGTPYTTYTMVFPPSDVPVATEVTQVTTTTAFVETSCVTEVATPTCSIGSDDCKALFSSWTAGGYKKGRPPCTYVLPKDPCDDCWIYVPSVRLMYFPVSMTGDFCGDYSTATPSGPVQTTVEISGTEFTQGTAYLSYAGVTATGASGICGTPLPSGILPIPSEDLFSYRGHAAAMSIMSQQPLLFNFADLAPNPVPWDAWISQETCYTHQDYPQCQTITQEAYSPWLVYPDAFGKMDRKWSKCVSGIFGIMDPPTALQTVDEVVKPTTASGEVDPTKAATGRQHPVATTPKASASTRGQEPDKSLQPLLTATEDPESSLSTGSKTNIENGGDPKKTGSTSDIIDPPGSKRSLPIVLEPTSRDAVEATFAHDSTRVTMSGYVDDSGTSVFTYSSKTFKLDGPALTMDGTTYSTIGESDDFGRTSLPTVVSAETSNSPVATAASSAATSSVVPDISVRPPEPSSGVKGTAPLIRRILATWISTLIASLS